MQSCMQVLVQEVQRVNSLLTVVRNSLTDLGKAVRGLALMSADLDAVGKALFDGKVPAMWLKKSFPSLKVRHPTSSRIYYIYIYIYIFSSSLECWPSSHVVAQPLPSKLLLVLGVFSFEQGMHPCTWVRMGCLTCKSSCLI